MPLRIELNGKAKREILSAAKSLGKDATPLKVSQLTGYSLIDVKTILKVDRQKRRSQEQKESKAAFIVTNLPIPKWVTEVEKTTGLTLVRHDGFWVLLSPTKVPLMKMIGNDQKNIVRDIQCIRNLLSLQGLTTLEFDRRRNAKKSKNHGIAE